ncbi:MAG: hypothetical protein KatS3mg108_3398 [Isosphaeraceae bacterium]|jgi:hypothetical protein|nr:MAG: hypothetical protein KatS3mg108_3398 [Isosphaeraceae bacterium]
MGKPGRSLRELRAEYEAAVARGLIPEEPPKRTRDSYARPATRRSEAPAGNRRQKIVWVVCDVGGRPIAQFAYTEKPEAEALAAGLKAQGRGTHFVRAEKVPFEA